MAYDTNFDYDRLLTLNQAKLVGRTRINNLGSYELTLNYNKITSAAKEDCLEWLESERLSIEDPVFSNKTYEGVWKCVSIAYDENKSIIQQVFKIDSSVGDLGDWDGTPPEPLEAVWKAQSGDTSRISDGMLVEKAYYWKVTSPEDVNLPETEIEGQIWTKTANDNGDGTYDVVVSREEERNLDGASKTISAGYTELTNTETNEAPVDLPTSATDGAIVSVTNTPKENGLFKTSHTTKTFVNQTGDSAAQIWADGEGADVTELTDILISGGTLTGVNQYYEHTAGTIGQLDAVWTGRTDSSWQVSSAYNSDFVNATLNRNGNYWRINSSTYGEEAYHPYEELNSGDWFTGATTSTPASDYYRYDLIIQIGFNEPASETTSDVNTNSSQVVFGSGVGEEAYPTIGQEKTISNVPLDNGKFKTTVTTTTVKEQRVPALTGSIPFSNNSTSVGIQVENYNGNRGSIVIGKNATYMAFQAAVNEMNKFRGTDQNSVSFNINKYGLYDYTLRSADI